MRILRNPEAADLDGSKTISFTESVVLGIALSINNLAGGFDAGITHLNIWIVSLISGMLSYLSVGLCSYVGYRFAADKLGKKGKCGVWNTSRSFRPASGNVRNFIFSKKNRQEGYNIFLNEMAIIEKVKTGRDRHTRGAHGMKPVRMLLLCLHLFFYSIV